MSLKPGTILNERYKIETILGEGGMGAVYRAQDQFRGNQLVAVKEFRLQHLPSEDELHSYQKGKPSNDIITREKSLAQFRLEAQLLAGLDHPNLPKVTDYFTSGKDYYIIMTLIVGKDASTLLSSMNGKPLPERAVYVWMRQVMDAVIYCHSKGVIHRDIKPANIILTVSGTVYLVDFGIAKVDSPSKMTSLGARVVTPGFSPPEQYSLGRTDARSDIYSLGATLYMMLTGHQPIESINRYMGMTLPEPHELVPEISSALEEVILKAIDLQPDDRFQSVLEMKQAFSAAFGISIPTPGVSAAAGASEMAPSQFPDSATEPLKKEQTETQPQTATEVVQPTPPEQKNAQGLQQSVNGKPSPGVQAGAQPEPVKKKPGNFLRTLFGTTKEEPNVPVSRIPIERKKMKEAELGVPIQRIYWVPQGDLLAIVTDSSVSLFDREEVRTLWQEENGFQSSCSVAFSNDRTLMAVGQGNQVKVWNLMSTKVIHEFTLDHEYPVFDLTIPENGSLLVAGGNPNGNRLKIWEMHSKKEYFSISQSTSQPEMAVFSPGGKVLAAAWMGYSGTGAPDGMLRLYDLFSFREFYQVPVSAGTTPILRFASGEMTFALGCSQSFALRNLRVFRPPSSLEIFGKDHATSVVDASFDLDVELLATIGNDGTVKIWDLDDNSELLLDQFSGIQQATCISFSPKDRLAAVGTQGGLVRLYPYRKIRPV